MPDRKKRDASEAPRKRKVEQSDHSKMSLGDATMLVAARLRRRPTNAPADEVANLHEIRDALTFLCVCMSDPNADLEGRSPRIKATTRVLMSVTDSQLRSLRSTSRDRVLLESYFVAARWIERRRDVRRRSFTKKT